MRPSNYYGGSTPIYIDTVRLLDLELTYAQLAACRFLELRGQRMCVDFGYENAVQKAMDCASETAH